MKEKTFRELLKPHQKRLDWHNQNGIWIDKADVLNLLQQVREATISECAEVAREHWTSPEFHIKHLPTDRIKLTEK